MTAEMVQEAWFDLSLGFIKTGVTFAVMPVFYLPERDWRYSVYHAGVV